MNAEETFKLTLKSIETVHKDLLESVFKAIEEARDRGEFSIAWPLAQVKEEAVIPVWNFLESKNFKVHREHEVESVKWVDERYGPFRLFKDKTPKCIYSYHLRISWWKQDSSV